MSAAWAHAACAAAAFSGWLAWALSVERHRAGAALPAEHRHSPGPARARAAALLLTSQALAFAHEGASFGALLGLSWLSTSGFAVVLLLAWWPRRAPAAARLGLVALAVAGGAWLLGA